MPGSALMGPPFQCAMQGGLRVAPAFLKSGNGMPFSGKDFNARKSPAVWTKKKARPTARLSESVFVLSRLGLVRNALLLAKSGAAREAHAPLVVYADAFDENFVPELAYVFGLVDAEVRKFRDVHEPLFAG